MAARSRRGGPRLASAPESPPKGLLRQGNDLTALSRNTVITLLGTEARRKDKASSYVQTLKSSDATARSIDDLSKTEIENKLTGCIETFWETYDTAKREFDEQNVEAPAPAAVELSEETLEAEVTKVLKENTAERSELFALCRRIDDITFTESQLAGNIPVDELQSKLRQWVDAQHEQQTVSTSRLRSVNDWNTLFRWLKQLRGAAPAESINFDDIGEEISNALSTIPSQPPNRHREDLNTTKWVALRDFFADGGSMVLAEGYGPPERTLQLCRDIGNLEEPVVDKVARGKGGKSFACNECDNCKLYMGRFLTTGGTVAISAKDAGHNKYKKTAGEGAWRTTYMCSAKKYPELSADEISIKKCNAICQEVARLCHNYNSDLASLLDDEQLETYAKAAMKLKHNNHRGLGLTRDVTAAVAASLRAGRRSHLSDRSSRGDRRDNLPNVRAARAGPLHRFATRRGGAGQYTED